MKQLNRMITHRDLLRAKSDFSLIQYGMDNPGQSYLNGWRASLEAGKDYPAPEAWVSCPLQKKKIMLGVSFNLLANFDSLQFTPDQKKKNLERTRSIRESRGFQPTVSGLYSPRKKILLLLLVIIKKRTNFYVACQSQQEVEPDEIFPGEFAFLYPKCITFFELMTMMSEGNSNPCPILLPT